MRLRFKPSLLGWSFLAFLACLVVTGVLVYQFFLVWLFGEAKRQAEAYGYQVEWAKADLNLSGSLSAKRLDILLEIEKVSVVPLKELKGSIQLEKAFLEASYSFNHPELVVHKLAIEGTSGEIELPGSFAAPEKEVSLPKPQAQKSLGDLFQISIRVPELPFELQLKQILISGSALKFKGLGSTVQFQAIDLKANLSHRQAGTFFVGESNFKISKLDWEAAGAGRPRGQPNQAGHALDLGLSSISAKWKIGGEGAWTERSLKPSQLELHLDVDDFGARIEKSHSMAAKKMKGTAKLVEGVPELDWKFTDLKSSVQPNKIFSGELKLQPRKNLSNRDWELKLDGQLENLLQLSGSLDLADAWAGIPKNFSGKVHLKIAKAFFDLFLPKIPAALKLPIQVDGNFSVKNEEVSRFLLKLESKWLQGQLTGKLNASTKNFDVKGQVGLYLPPSGLQIYGHKLAGQAVVPITLVYRARERIFLESKIIFNDFSYAAADFALESIRGELQTYQAWRVQQGRWTLAPLQSWNPFLQVDPASASALDEDQSGLVVSKLRIFDKRLGPLFLSGSLRQNHFTIPNWRLQLPKGEFQGALYFDFQPQQPRVGFLLESRSSDLSQILSARFLGARPFQSDPTSFKLATDWDINEALIFGTFDWYQMSPGQVHNVLDFMDPQGENNTFNMTRNLLNQAYPTRVHGELKGSLAHFFVDTNLLKIPPIRDVPLKAYLIKMKEMISPILNLTLIKEN